MSAAIRPASIQWNEALPRSTDFDDIYFSTSDGLAETRHVFIQQNRLQEKWTNSEPATHIVTGGVDTGDVATPFVIGETGFGTGLNFLAAWQLWNQCRQMRSNNQRLHYIAVEKFPLSPADLSRALQPWTELTPLTEQLLEQYSGVAVQGFQHLMFGDVNLTLIIDDAMTGLEQLLVSDIPGFRKAVQGVDAWFLDGFAPAKNPDMWTPKLFQVIAELSHPGSTLATFTAAGMVRRGLERTGFRVEKIPGFGRKRDMVRAEFSGLTDLPPMARAASSVSVPWYINNRSCTDTKKQATIIGAGLAGCHTANALARRGWQVTVFDKGAEPGAGASGNPQGIVYGKLSKDNDQLAQLNLACLLFAQQHYQPFWQAGGQFGEQCGVMQLGFDERHRKILQQLQPVFGQPNNLLRFLTPNEASALAGIPVSDNALLFPRLGWLNPPLVCRQLLAHPAITFTGQSPVNNITLADDNQWLLETGTDTFRAKTLIIANAGDAVQFPPTRDLPLKPVRGQISVLEGEQIIPALKTVLCAEGYLAPVSKTHPHQTRPHQILGASFTLHNHSHAVTPEDNRQNLEQLKMSIPGLDQLLPDDGEAVRGRVGFRCTTPDYLPLAGPVHQREAFLRDYAPLRKDARTDIPRPGKHWPNLFVNLGHGSRGLAYTPLCAEILAAQVCGDILPIPRRLARALHPARFLIRDLIRNRL